ncbi:MAG: thermonuclease family protein [Pseudomonadota bacterium]|nr:thermonuclease family protein [Pseudomonadota bacterium]
MRRRVFLLLLLGSLGSPTWAAVCATSGPVARAAVERVIDGDTLVLRDGQRLRLIGIDAPEIRHDGRGPEPYAREARAALIDLSAGRVVGVQYAQSPHDRFGRALAHLFLANGDNVQASLLRRGLATSLFLPPNGEYLDCYVAAETEARAARRGIWSQAGFQPIAAQRIGRAAQGYRVVTGTVTSARCRRTGVWLRLDGVLGVKIGQQDLGYFKGGICAGCTGGRCRFGVWCDATAGHHGCVCATRSISTPGMEAARRQAAPGPR